MKQAGEYISLLVLIPFATNTVLTTLTFFTGFIAEKQNINVNKKRNSLAVDSHAPSKVAKLQQADDSKKNPAKGIR